jgi:hypothetical protein
MRVIANDPADYLIPALLFLREGFEIFNATVAGQQDDPVRLVAPELGGHFAGVDALIEENRVLSERNRALQEQNEELLAVLSAYVGAEQTLDAGPDEVVALGEARWKISGRGRLRSFRRRAPLIVPEDLPE